MARTFGPTATTVAHASRLPTWAVAGMRMPPEERRSPSARSIFTRMRSLSILMGCRSFDEFSNVLAGRTGRGGGAGFGLGGRLIGRGHGHLCDGSRDVGGTGNPLGEPRVACGAMAARRCTLEVTDGTRLEAEVDLPDDAVALAVLAHPHPLYGGSMDAGLIDELFHLLPRDRGRPGRGAALQLPGRGRLDRHPRRRPGRAPRRRRGAGRAPRAGGRGGTRASCAAGPSAPT